MTRKLAALALSVLSVLLLFAGCAKVGLHATVLDDNASALIRPDFYDSHYTFRAHGADGVDPENDPNPSFRFFFVTSREEQDRILSGDFSVSVDYDREMLLVYTFTAAYVRPIELKELRADSGTLTVILSMEQKRFPPVADACQPFQRYVILKMDKADVSDAVVTVKT
ncbi:MAG: hypothetical protein IKS35_00230 [Clostridia bacterium]|nr:hypothetical protein [Clostridia bacterium]